MKMTGLNKPSIWRLGKNGFMNDLTAEKLAAPDILLLLSGACPVPDIPPWGERLKKAIFGVSPMGRKLQYVYFGVSPTGGKSQKAIFNVSPVGGKLQYVYFSVSPMGGKVKSKLFRQIQHNEV
jgi:hypothetical protein